MINLPSMALPNSIREINALSIERKIDIYKELLPPWLKLYDLNFGDLTINGIKAVEIRWLVERIHALTRSRSRLAFGALPYRAHEAMFAAADTTALRALGWRPRVSLEEGLQQTIAAAPENAPPDWPPETNPRLLPSQSWPISSSRIWEIVSSGNPSRDVNEVNRPFCQSASPPPAVPIQRCP